MEKTINNNHMNSNEEFFIDTNKSSLIYYELPDEFFDPKTIDIDIKTGTITFNSKHKKHNSKGHCYLTSACLQHYKENFNDDCEELTILRWFRDNFVSAEDIVHYYKTAPIIVEAINKIDSNATIYNYIYDKVVKPCVDAIKAGNYQFAYERYKSSILILEEEFARPLLESSLLSYIKKQTFKI